MRKLSGLLGLAAGFIAVILGSAQPAAAGLSASAIVGWPVTGVELEVQLPERFVEFVAGENGSRSPVFATLAVGSDPISMFERGNFQLGLWLAGLRAYSQPTGSRWALTLYGNFAAIPLGADAALLGVGLALGLGYEWALGSTVRVFGDVGPAFGLVCLSPSGCLPGPGLVAGIRAGLRW